MTNQTARLQTGHIGLNVTDLDRATEFYSDIFGFQILTRSNEPGRRYAFLGSVEAGPALTLWEQSSGQFAPRMPGLHHLSFQAETVDAVREIEQHVRRRGIPLIHDGLVIHQEGADSGGIFFEDPDGIRLEVYAASGVGAHASASAEGSACGFF